MKKEDTETMGLPTFEQHVKSAVHGLRGSIAELIASVGSDPGQPQEMAKQYSVKTNLTYRISKFICEPDPYASIPYIPGKQGLNLFLKALEKSGASSKALAAVRKAMKEFDRMVEMHAGDRATLEMMLGNLTRDGERQRYEAHRKLSYQGNSATYGGGLYCSRGSPLITDNLIEVKGKDITILNDERLEKINLAG